MTRSPKLTAIHPPPSVDDLAAVDSPEATDEELALARPFSEVFPDLAASIKRVRGLGRKPAKVAVTLRLDADVLDAFKAGGERWQTRVNAALRKAAKLPTT
jgi:uncharacterized protein (DUF4415 family)